MRQFNISRALWSVYLLLPGLLLAGCSDSGKPGPPGSRTDKPAMARPAVDPAIVARGEQLFQKNCAACHGNRAQGAFNWQKPGADGKYPAPPLNGTAHDWHHPYAALKQTIRDGTQRIGGSMPAWGGVLSEKDIEAVIAWFQSLWPGEIYAAWADIDRRSRAGERAH